MTRYVKPLSHDFEQYKKLIRAVIRGKVDYVREMVPSNVAVNQPIISRPGGPATYMALLAVEHDQPQVLRYLLENRADLSKRDHRGMNMFSKVASLKHIRKDFTDMLFVPDNEKWSNLMNDQTITGNTAVHLAVTSKNLYTLDVMLKMTNKLKVATITNNNGDSPLILAIKNRLPTMASMLLEYTYYKSNEPLTTMDINGLTALEVADDCGFPFLVYMITSASFPRPDPCSACRPRCDCDQRRMRRSEYNRQKQSEYDQLDVDDMDSLSFDSAAFEDDYDVGLEYCTDTTIPLPTTTTGSGKKELTDELIKLTTENKVLKEKLDATNWSEMTQISDGEDVAKAKIDLNVNNRIESMRTMYETAIREKEEKINELYNTLGGITGNVSSSKNLEDEIIRLTERLEQVEESNRNLNACLEERQETVVETGDTVTELYKQNEELRGLVNDLTDTNNRYKQQIDELLNENITYSTETTQQKGTITGLQQQCSRLSNELEEALKNPKSLSSKVNEMTEHPSITDEGLTGKKRKKKIAQLKTDIKSVRAELISRTADAENRAHEIESLREYLQVANREIEDIKTKWIDANSELMETKSNLQVAVEKLAMSEGAVTSLSEALAKAKQITETHDEIALKTEKTNTDMTSEMKQIKTESGKLAKRLKEGEHEKSNLLDEIASLKEKLSTSSESSASLNHKIHDLNKQMSDVERNLAEEMEKSASFATSMAISKKKHAEALTELNDRIEQLESTLKDRDEVLYKTTQQVASLDKSKKILTESNATLQSNTFMLEAKLEEKVMELAAANKLYMQTLSDLQECDFSACEEQNKLRRLVTSLEKRLQLAEKKTKDMHITTHELERATTELVSAKKEIENMSQQHVVNLAQKDTETADLLSRAEEKFNDELRQNLERAKRETEAVKAKMAEMKVHFDEQMTSVMHDYEQSLNNLTSKHKTIESEMERDMDIERRRLNELYIKEADDLYVAYSEAIDSGGRAKIIEENKQLTDLLENNEDKYNQERRTEEARHQVEILAMRTEIDRLKLEITRLRASTIPILT